MAILREHIPDAATVWEMDTSDLAGYLLRALLSPKATQSGLWNRRNCIGAIGDEYSAPRQGSNEQVLTACAEAWQWLVANSFIVPDFSRDNDWYIATRRTKALPEDVDLRAAVAASELPEHFLHPEIALRARSLFLQGRLDTAVFEAFKSLEVAIRDAAGLGAEMIGTKLTSRAFNPEDGPLRDPDAEPGERQGLANLMTGAIGSYKNPHSHRRVPLTPAEAREIIMLASHLLKVVNARRKEPKA